jgi:GntR family transcriptional repressor for pyruvate dehydrogenase complex
MSRAEALARRLETEIGALAPGDRLGTKDELRRRFGVAAGTLNEAVRLMEVRGVVAARPGPGGGVFVAERRRPLVLGLDWATATLRDCAELRAALEPVVCRHAARERADLHGLVDAMAATLPDRGEYLAANWRFHRGVASRCTNEPLRAVYLTTLEFLERGLDDFEFTGHDYRAVTVHRRLADAIAAGEGLRLERAIRAHELRSPLPGSG